MMARGYLLKPRLIVAGEPVSMVGDGMCVLYKGSIVERGDTRAVIDTPSTITRSC
jgi:hypothetical protein